MRNEWKQILKELSTVLENSDFNQVDTFVNKIIQADKIVTLGAGRVGFMMKCFNMRLNHLGLKSFFLGDSNTPKTSRGDLLIVGSGSGNSLSVLSMVNRACDFGLEVLCITTNNKSEIAKKSSSVIILSCSNKESNIAKRDSIQPMTTLFEQSLMLVLDSIVLKLMKITNQTHDSMVERHNILE
jgi:6-phospho-3-hexuloisomerase